MNGSQNVNYLERFAGLRVVVCGDVILDHDVIADATRISPEAPVPVILNPRDEYRLGGAGAVAAMCKALGADVSLLSLIGDDQSGEIIRSLLESSGIHDRLVYTIDRRPTTTKLRISGVASGSHRQQLVRVDTESTVPIDDKQAADIAECIRRSNVDLLLVADYAKGLMTPTIAAACISHRLCIVDPPRGGNWNKYTGAACLTPNRIESHGRPAVTIAYNHDLQAAVVKLDSDGCELCDDDGCAHRLPSRARLIHDVTSCGDQFLAAFGLAKAAGATWLEAAIFANIAAGLQCERFGAVPVMMEELRQCLSGPFASV